MRADSVCQLLSRVRLSATPWTVARQALLSMGFSRPESWSGSHALLQGIFQTQGCNLCLLCLPALAGGFFTIRATWEARIFCCLQPKGSQQIRPTNELHLPTA